MGSLRIRRTVSLGGGFRLNLNKRSVGVSAGVPGVRESVNTDGRSTESIGVPGTGVYWREQHGPRPHRRIPAEVGVDPGSPLGIFFAWVGVVAIVAVVAGLLVFLAFRA